jgi:hypothetical protein
MKYSLSIILALFSFTICLSAQDRFNNCSAIFVNKKLLVDDYSPTGKCILKSTASGQLTVSTAIVENDQWRAVEDIYFNIIIRDGSTKTLLSYSNTTYKSIGVQDVLSKCKKGDRILISIIKDEYALPHNEILVE